MATDSRSIPNQTPFSDSLFRAWGGAISSCLDAGGLDKSSDTGQVDWTTVTRGTAGSWAGYEIWKLATDTKFSDLGLFIKIEYGWYDNLNGYVQLAFTVGTNTDGAGTLTGNVGTRRILQASLNSGTARTAYTCSIDGTVIAVLPFVAASNQISNFMLVVERLRNESGDLTSDGIYTFFSGPTTLNSYQNQLYTEIIRNTRTPAELFQNRLGAFVSNSSSIFSGDCLLASHYPADKNALFNPTLSSLFYFHTDLTAGTDITVSRYGTNRTYKALGRLPTTGSFSTAFGHTNAGIAILWE